MSARSRLPALLSDAVSVAVSRHAASAAPSLPRSAYAVTASRRGFPGDYQTAVAMSLARQTRQAPEALAAALCAGIRGAVEESVCPLSAVSTSRGGFVNLTLSDAWLAARVQELAMVGCTDTAPLADAPPSGTVGASAAGTPLPRALVDFASPNMGKELHPGHLRSAVIGDSLARCLEAAGWHVGRVSHVGDAGLPVAIVLAWFLCGPEAAPAWLDARAWTLRDVATGRAPLPSPHQLSRAYEAGKRLMDAGVAAQREAGRVTGAVAEAAGGAAAGDAAAAIAFSHSVHATLRELQAQLATGHVQAFLRALPGGEPADAPPVEASPALASPVTRAWVGVCEASRGGIRPLLRSLDVRVEERGESSYLPLCGPLVEALLASQLARESKGAIGLFVDGEGSPPLLLRKADGGFLYATVDLAALRCRLVAGWQRIIYVTDAAQGHHFRQLFAAARALGWLTPEGRNTLHAGGGQVQLEHVAFGLVTGADGGKLSSRSGAAATLQGMLEDAQVAVRAAAAAAQETARARREGGHGAGEAAHLSGGDAGEVAQLSAGGGAAAASAPPPAPLPPATIAAIAHSAVRYYDLAHATGSSYRLSMDAALALKGNTAPYLMYALARLRGIRLRAREAHAEAHKRGAGGALGGGAHMSSGPAAASAGEQSDPTGADEGGVSGGEGAAGLPSWAALRDALAALSATPLPSVAPLAHPTERALALSVLRQPDALDATLAALSPHLLAEYAAGLATDFHAFYDACRVVQLVRQPDGEAAAAPYELDAQALALSLARLQLCAAVDHVLRSTCHALGVRIVVRM